MRFTDDLKASKTDLGDLRLGQYIRYLTLAVKDQTYRGFPLSEFSDMMETLESLVYLRLDEVQLYHTKGNGSCGKRIERRALDTIHLNRVTFLGKDKVMSPQSCQYFWDLFETVEFLSLEHVGSGIFPSPRANVGRRIITNTYPPTTVKRLAIQIDEHCTPESGSKYIQIHLSPINIDQLETLELSHYEILDWECNLQIKPAWERARHVSVGFQLRNEDGLIEEGGCLLYY